MERKIILLSGAHGVGKGYFLSNNFSSPSRFTIVSASDLIKRYKQADDAGYKRVKNISDNQEILLVAFEKEKNAIKNDIILDGHLCMINAKGKVERIPEQFLVKSQIDGIVLLQDEVDSIVTRLEKRDGTNISKSIIEQMQYEEREYCKELQLKNHIPYDIISNTCDYQKFCDIVSQM